MLTRHPGTDDLHAMYLAMREILIADEGECDWTEEDMGVMWRSTDPESMWVVEDSEGRIAALGGVRPRHPTRLRSWSGVLPEFRGRGIGTQLLGLIEERAVEMAAKAPAGETVMLGQDVGHLNTDAAPLLERHGYEYARTFWKMGIELDAEPPEPAVPEGLRFEAMRAGLERAVFDAAEEAFRDHWDHKPHDYGEWRAWMIDRPSFDPTVWVLAFDGDEIAGGSLNYVEPEEGWVGVLFSRRPWRRRGLGKALLLASFREFRKRGVARAALGVDAENPTGATHLYESAGMHVVHESRFYWKPVPR